MTILPSDTPEADAAGLVEPAPSAGSLVNLPELQVPAPTAGDGEVILFLEAPWYTHNFDPSVEGCPVITQAGTPVAEGLVDQVTAIGADNGVTITKR